MRCELVAPNGRPASEVLDAAGSALKAETFTTASWKRPIEVSVDVPEAAKSVSESLLTTGRHTKVAVAQISCEPGQIALNTEKIIACIDEAVQRGAQVIAFPELAVTGYCSMDLVFNKTFLQQNLLALQKIREATRGKNIIAIVGFVDWNPDVMRPGNRPTIYNSAAVLHDGTLVAVRDKQLHPNYEIFYEDRYWADARPDHLGVVEVNGLRLAVEICEDLWSDGYAVNPTADLAQGHPDLYFNLSASPFHIGKLPVRAGLIEGVTQKYKAPFIYTNLVGAYDGYEGDVVFDGRSIVMGSDGSIKALGKGFKEQLMIVDVYGPQDLVLPAVHEVEELHDALVLGIRDYFARLERIKPGAGKQAVLGISGGVDSALVAALAVEALGSDRVVGITMPTKYNSGETKGAAYDVAHNLGIRMETVPIQKMLDTDLEVLGNSLAGVRDMPENVAEENLQARQRMKVLMYFTNKFGGVVLNTGNKTELTTDNFTLYGDSCGMLGVLADVDKDRVYALCSYINKKAGREIIPQFTIDVAPKAELKDGQVDADVMGADPRTMAPLVRGIVEGDLSLAESKERFVPEFSDWLIERTHSRMHGAEFKRRQLPGGIRVTPHAFGNGRRIPINHGFKG